MKQILTFVALKRHPDMFHLSSSHRLDGELDYARLDDWSIWQSASVPGANIAVLAFS